jgi:hypothetical protein
VKDNQGKEVTTDTNTILFSIEDKRPPVETTVWFYGENMEFDATHPLYSASVRRKGCLCDYECILR